MNCQLLLFVLTPDKRFSRTLRIDEQEMEQVATRVRISLLKSSVIATLLMMPW